MTPTQQILINRTGWYLGCLIMHASTGDDNEFDRGARLLQQEIEEYLKRNQPQRIIVDELDDDEL